MSFINMYEESKRCGRRSGLRGRSISELGYGLYYNEKTKSEQVQVGICKEVAKKAGLKIGDTVQTISNSETRQVIIKRELEGSVIRPSNKKSTSGRLAYSFTPYKNDLMPKSGGTVVYPKDIDVKPNFISFVVPQNGEIFR